MLDRYPTPRQLRQFAFAGIVLMPLAAWLLSGMPSVDGWQRVHTLLVGGLATLGALFVVLSFAAPRILRPVYVGMSLVTLPIGLVVGELLLALTYFGVFTPVGLVFRLIGRDALERRVDRTATTYWRAKRQPRDAASYFRQS